MKVWYRATLVVLALVVGSCVTRPPADDVPEDILSLPEEPSDEPLLDLAKVRDLLNMDRESYDLGFAQKRFTACQLGLSKTQCHMQYLVVINFQLMCRDSVGTVESVNSWAFEPLKSSYIYWRLSPKRGRVRTDENGYGQILTTAPNSLSSVGLILISGSKSLKVGLDGARKIVVPNDWCDHL